MDSDDDVYVDCDNTYRFKPFSFSVELSRRCPVARSGHRIVCDGEGNLYCYGGYNPALLDDSDDESLPLFKQVWKYNIARGRWNKLKVSDIPDELVSCFLFIYRDNLSVFGGTGYPFGAFSSNNVSMFCLSSTEKRFTCLEVRGDLPTPQYGQGCVLDGNIFYTIGGTNGYDYNCDIHKLDLRTGVWESLYVCTGKTNEPYGRYRHEVAYDGERIYLIGGGTVDLNANLDYIPVFHISSRRWDLVKSEGDPQYNYPSPRKYHSCVRLPQQHKFLIIGGYDDNNVYSDCWLLDLTDLSWKCMPSLTLPLATYFNSSAITPSGKVYTYGGVHHTSKSPERTSNMFTAWLTIPSLKDICWDALKYYNFIEYYSKTELRSLGVPLSCINEID